MVMRIRLAWREGFGRLIHHHPPAAPSSTMTMASPRGAYRKCVFATVFRIVL